MVNGEYISIEEAEKYLDKEIAKREELLDYLIQIILYVMVHPHHQHTVKLIYFRI